MFHMHNQETLTCTNKDHFLVQGNMCSKVCVLSTWGAPRVHKNLKNAHSKTLPSPFHARVMKCDGLLTVFRPAASNRSNMKCSKTVPTETTPSDSETDRFEKTPPQ